jgi:LmbE family N-acetylglucosaminyl deacetylase
LSDVRALAVLSPHLDDAVLSLGGFLRSVSRLGRDVLVVTVLANNPTAPGPATAWDAACGFESAAAAAQGRRLEDRRACASVGARSHWLPYGDETYGRDAADNEIWTEIRAVINGVDLVLVPGFPLRLADHRWLANLVAARRSELDCPIWLYGEQPYAAGSLLRARAALPPDGAGPPGLPVTWRRIRTSPADRVAKLRAISKYHSQLRRLGLLKLAAVQMEELARRGELLGWNDRAVDSYETSGSPEPRARPRRGPP